MVGRRLTRTIEQVCSMSHDPRAGPSDCVLISSYGKSGSKRLMRILDFSRKTHCRNEPNNLETSPFKRLLPPNGGWVVTSDDERRFNLEWEAAVQWESQRIGALDGLRSLRKYHIYPFSQHIGLQRLMRSHKARRALGVIMPAYQQDEWLMPGWLGSRCKLRNATLAIRLNQVPGLTVWLLRNRVGTRVMHLIRHPGAILYSWSLRWLQLSDREDVRKKNVHRLAQIGSADSAWAQLFGDNVDSMSAEEAELWYWRYMNEIIYAAGCNRAQYERVRDEDVVQDPVALGRRLYDACGLEWDIDVESNIRRRAANWKECSARWIDLLDSKQIALVQRILADSVMSDWWTNDQIVSRIDYEWD